MNFFHSPIQFSQARLPRAGVAAVVLLSFAACIAGVPIYRAPQKDRSKPFPCQNNPCGCADAETCWRDCCCNTHAQKIAWAKENGVKPPDFVFELAREELATAKNCSGDKPCCKKAETRACCKAHGKEACCKKTGDDEQERGEGDWVTWIGRQTCKGQSLSWLMLGHSIPLARPVAVDAPEGLVQSVCEPILMPRAILTAPDPPPPRVSLA